MRASRLACYIRAVSGSVLIEFLTRSRPSETRALARGQIEAALAEEKDKNGGDFASAYRRASPVLEGVYQMVATVLTGTLGGWWLDKELKTAPLLMIAGAVLGIGGGLTVFLRAVLRMSHRKAGPQDPGGGSTKKQVP